MKKKTIMPDEDGLVIGFELNFSKEGDGAIFIETPDSFEVKEIEVVRPDSDSVRLKFKTAVGVIEIFMSLQDLKKIAEAAE